MPAEQRELALAEIVGQTSRDALTENRRIHRFLADGFQGISYIDADGIEQTPTIRLVSHDPHVRRLY